MSALGTWLETGGREKATDFGFVVADLTAEEVVETPNPLENLIGVALTGISPFSIEAHAGLIVAADQRWNSEKTYIQYDRVITEGSISEFVAPDGIIRTLNTIDKSGPFGIHIPYTLHKDFRWVKTDADKFAVIARSWVEEEGCSGDDGDGKPQSVVFHRPLVRRRGRRNHWLTSMELLQTSVDSLLTEEFLVKTMVNGRKTSLRIPMQNYPTTNFASCSAA